VKLEAINAEVQALDRLDLQDLRAEWRRRWGVPSRQRSAQILRHMMAWRIQVEAFGAFDQRTRAALLSGNPGVTPVHLDVGARLTREWKGVRYEVEVAEGGYLHAGARYGSLSEVARAITGTRWNGLRFFGLRNEVGE
jgi:hypothetical protein